MKTIKNSLHCSHTPIPNLLIEFITFAEHKIGFFKKYILKKVGNSDYLFILFANCF